MDVTELLGNNVTVEAVESSPTKQLVILSAGAMQLQPDGKNKMNILVEIDGKQKNWKPNRESLKNVSDKHGKESAAWIGKIISLSVGVSKNGMKMVIGRPI